MSPLGKFKTDDRRHVEIVENGVFAERRRGRGGLNTVQGEAERNQSREGKGREAHENDEIQQGYGNGRERKSRDRRTTDRRAGTRGASMQLSIRFDDYRQQIDVDVCSYHHPHPRSLPFSLKE